MTFEAFTPEEKAQFAVANAEAIITTNVKEIAEKAINFTCATHGVTRDQLRPEIISQAYSEAREKVQHERELKADTRYQEMEAVREKNRLLELELESLRNIRPNASGDNTLGRQTGTNKFSSTAPPADAARREMGAFAWNQLTEKQQLAASGIAPDQVTTSVRQECSELFGKKSNSKRANDLSKESPGRYKFLRNVAAALDLFGK